MRGHVTRFIFRNLSLKPSATSSLRSAPCHQTVRERHDVSSNSSFVHNIFCGRLETAQVLPYPDVLTDELESVPAATLEALKAAGGFGLQVPEEFGGAGLNSTQYGRLTEVIGENDLGLGVFLTGHQGIGFK